MAILHHDPTESFRAERMLRSLKDLQRYHIHAQDGVVGSVSTFLFNDMNWTLRYLVVDTGRWLPGRRVIVNVDVIRELNWRTREVHVALTKEQIEQSPQFPHPETADGKDLKNELLELPVYFHPTGISPGYYTIPLRADRGQGDRVLFDRERKADTHLRSTKNVIGYTIEATDDQIGQVNDLIVEQRPNWLIRYLVVDTHTFLPGRKVLIAKQWVKSVDWLEMSVRIDLTRDQIEQSPEFDPNDPVNREYEVVLYDYYGRPKYWD